MLSKKAIFEIASKKFKSNTGMNEMSKIMVDNLTEQQGIFFFSKQIVMLSRCYFFVCPSAAWRDFIHVVFSIFISIYLPVYIPNYQPTFLSSYSQTKLTYLHTRSLYLVSLQLHIIKFINKVWIDRWRSMDWRGWRSCTTAWRNDKPDTP